MPKKGNSSPGEPFKVTLSRQSILLLELLAKRGIYGRNSAEVGGRLIDQALGPFVETPRFTLGVGRVRLVKAGGTNAGKK